MEGLIKIFINKYICFHNLFKVREAWNKRQSLKEDMVVKRLRNTDLHEYDAAFFEKTWCKNLGQYVYEGASMANHLEFSIIFSGFGCRVEWDDRMKCIYAGTPRHLYIAVG